MLKILHLLIVTVLFTISTNMSAQSDFKFKQTNYVGALNQDLSDDWTIGWTNWDPKNAIYPEPTDITTLNGMLTSLPVPGEKDITSIVALSASNTYLLQGLIVVRSGGKLIIPAGTIIRCHSDISATPKNYASIIVERGGQIEIQGTADNPVVFTSNRPVGQRERGDWGGILIAGKSFHNLLNGTTNDNVQMEGFNNISFDPSLAKFGGTDGTDNSGSIEYLRIEFGGLAFEANKEINGLTLGAVGSATVLNHVQVSFSGDDSYEWFGGTVNSSNLIAYKGTDDDFDTDNGYSGLSQFGIAVKDSAYYDLTYNLPSGASTSEGFESDNEATGTANVKPYTSGIFSNYTMIGPVPVGSKWSDMTSVTKAAFRRGARIRRNSSLRIINSIFMGYRNFLMVDGDSSLRNTNFPEALALVTPNTPVDLHAKQLFFANNLIVNTGAAFSSATDSTANGLVEATKGSTGVVSLARRTALNDWVRQPGPLANKIDPVPFTSGTVLVNPLASSTSPDFRPVSGSPALMNANFLANPLLDGVVASHEISEALESAVYPNPVHNGTLNFSKEVKSFGIFNLTGKLMKYGESANQVDVSNLTNGIYIIKLEGKAQKFIVQ